MRRKRNALIWTGFAVVLLAALTYNTIFIRFPVTRDFPWVNLLLFAAGGCMIAAGVYRAYSRPERYRGKVSSVVVGGLALALFAAFYWGMFVFARQLPASEGAPRAGSQAPDFALTDASGKSVSLAEMRRANRFVLLIFYRGYW